MARRVLTHLRAPKGLTLDGNLYVVEDDNSQVLEFNNPLPSPGHLPTPNTTANLVFGQPDFTSTEDEDLYVTDEVNNRPLRFDQKEE